MFNKLFFVKCIEMTWQSFRPNSFNDLSLNLRSRLHFESLESFLIGSLRLELWRFILTQTDHGIWALSNSLQHFVMLFQFSLLLFVVVLFVIRFTFKWQRIEWILWMLLVKYIILTIFPIWEVLLIRRKSNNWFFFIIYFFSFFISRSNLKIFEILVFCSFHIHLMRVDNFTFFFQIKSFSILNDNCIFEFLLIVFLITTQ